MNIGTIFGKLSIVAGELIVTAATAGNAYASTMFFTDVNAFDALTDTTLIEDFEAFPYKAYPGNNQIFPSFVSNGNTYTGHPNVFVSSAGATSYGVPITTSSIITANGDEDFTVEFGTPTEAVGFDTYLNAYGPATVSVFGANNLLDTFVLNQDPTTVGFLGILASEEISSIRWTTVNGGKINTGIDNIIQGSRIDKKSTPESSLLIGIVSTFVIAVLSRKKQVTVK